MESIISSRIDPNEFKKKKEKFASSADCIGGRGGLALLNRPWGAPVVVLNIMQLQGVSNSPRTLRIIIKPMCTDKRAFRISNLSMHISRSNLKPLEHALP